ncbi:MAG TPA: uroporphyrinogen decarboxylase family protein [Clostridiales bacterium]|nr:uroporphyrinogen decarboxylase family protein [Clostridiales bacterium]
MELKMNSRGRVLTALKRGIPDAVPYMYNTMDKELQEKIIGKEISLPTETGMNSLGYLSRPGDEAYVSPILTLVPEVADLLGLDAIGIKIFPPLFVDGGIRDGRAMIKKGLLNTREALEKCKMPDPDDDKLYKSIEKLLDVCAGDRAIYAKIRLGASSTLMSMDMMGFSYNLHDDPELVSEVLMMYCSWSQKICRNLCEMGFDFIWCFDDIAFKTAPMFSPDVLNNIFLPILMKTTSSINKPWVFHSDGNVIPFLDDLLKLDMDGLHPLEPGAMDLDSLKSKYGSKLCLIGNIDIDKTLTRGTIQDVDNEVRERICLLGKGGGYIISDSNSVPAYCKAENVIAMSNAVSKYRYIY